MLISKKEKWIFESQETPTSSLRKSTNQKRNIRYSDELARMNAENDTMLENMKKRAYKRQITTDITAGKQKTIPQFINNPQPVKTPIPIPTSAPIKKPEPVVKPLERQEYSGDPNNRGKYLSNEEMELRNLLSNVNMPGEIPVHEMPHFKHLKGKMFEKPEQVGINSVETLESLALKMAKRNKKSGRLV